MPRRLLHGVEHGVDEGRGHLFVEKVAHGIYKYAARLPPPKWLLQAFRSKRQIEAMLKGMVLDPPETFGEPLGITKVTPRRDLGASRYGVPCRIRPFNFGGISHSPR